MHALNARSHQVIAWRMHKECTEKWFVRCYSLSFVTCLSSALHQRFSFMTIRLVCWAPCTILNMFKVVRGTRCINVHVRRMPEGPTPKHAIHAEHSLDIRCMFVGWDVANTHGDIELPPYVWCNWWQACQLQVSFKQRFHILGPTTVTTTKGSTLLSSWHS